MNSQANKPFFSVIIPLYNKEEFIENTIKSVLNQTFKNYEIIIVNDGSTDNGVNIALTFKNEKTRIISQKNSGVSVARNRGIEESNATYIALLDADDIWHTNHLSELKKLIETFPAAGLYCNNYQVFRTKNIYTPAKFNFKYHKDCVIVDDFFKASLVNCVAWTSAVGFSKNNFDSLGGFNTHLKTAQDLDLWIRFALQYQVAFNPAITMSYNLYVGDSLSKSELNHIRYDFINKYSKEEQQNKSLKHYLDYNRFAVALRCKMNDEIDLYNKLKQQIDLKNLNFKQRLLINLPIKALEILKKTQLFLVKRKLYLTAFK
ncbi:glycosyltransferase [Tamlana sp. I1]|uniref:glycosyltransferase n=1 Tax=Tamlana sp. I1 TaxID=2762061 RepID=UPI00188EE234|nr:glycosyltransferase [Tamlana sp. I1]